MERIRVNRFKTYRKMRWYRSNYLWQPKGNTYLKKYGIDVVDDSSEPSDVLAIPCPHIPGREIRVHQDIKIWIERNHCSELEFSDSPMICDSSLDYAYLDPPVRNLINHPQVRAYMTGVSFRDPAVQQRKSWGGEYYGMVLKERELHNKGPDVRGERQSLTDQIASKIQPINRPPTPPFSDSVFEYIAAKVKPLKEREIDLFFSGRIRYSPSHIRNHPTTHRQRMESMWESLPGKNKVLRTYDNFTGTRKAGEPVEIFKYPYDYVDQLLNSKVVISPWGWSSWCVRDLEALACGCIVIKPECSNTLIYPDIYDANKQLMVWCDIMFEGLSDQLNYCYTHLDELQDRADRGRKFVTDSLYPNDKLYASWTRSLRKTLEGALERPAYALSRHIPHPIVE